MADPTPPGGVPASARPDRVVALWAGALIVAFVLFGALAPDAASATFSAAQNWITGSWAGSTCWRWRAS